MKKLTKKAKIWIILLAIILALATVATVLVIVDKRGVQVVDEYVLYGRVVNLLPSSPKVRNEKGYWYQNYYLLIELENGDRYALEETLDRIAHFEIGDYIYVKATVRLSGLGIYDYSHEYSFTPFDENNNP